VLKAAIKKYNKQLADTDAVNNTDMIHWMKIENS